MIQAHITPGSTMQNHFKATMRRWLCQFAFGRELGTAGAAAVEFAILSSLLVLMMVAVIDLGMGLYRGIQVRNAAQAGAAYAMAKGYNASSMTSAILNATSFSQVSASPAPTQFCGCPTTAGITTATCGSACAGGSTAGTYVTASATGSYTTLMRYPLFPDSFNYAIQATVRIQ